MIVVGAVMFFLLYVTSVGVSASNSAGNISTAATLAHTTTVYRTKTVTKTVHDTTTVFIDSTTTATSTVTDTSTSTVTSTTTSAVCCQTTTTTVTQPAVTTTVTSTTTVTPQISGDAGSPTFPPSATNDDKFFTDSKDCAVTVALTTSLVTYAGATVTLRWSDTAGNFYVANVASGSDTPGFYATISTDSATIEVNNPSTTYTVTVGYSYTAICPS